MTKFIWSVDQTKPSCWSCESSKLIWEGHNSPPYKVGLRSRACFLTNLCVFCWGSECVKSTPTISIQVIAHWVKTGGAHSLYPNSHSSGGLSHIFGRFGWNTFFISIHCVFFRRKSHIMNYIFQTIWSKFWIEKNAEC